MLLCPSRSLQVSSSLTSGADGREAWLVLQPAPVQVGVDVTVQHFTQRTNVQGTACGQHMSAYVVICQHEQTLSRRAQHCTTQPFGLGNGPEVQFSKRAKVKLRLVGPKGTTTEADTMVMSELTVAFLRV
jgi:hypothetical protein